MSMRQCSDEQWVVAALKRAYVILRAAEDLTSQPDYGVDVELPSAAAEQHEAFVGAAVQAVRSALGVYGEQVS